jgi:LysR family transcriptional regulator, transcription activator of glutamate synthase operon
MDTEVLRWFQQVADGVTVTELSQLERLTQPGVSRALARLEDEVGTPLLYRSGRRLRLTRAGSVFRRHVDTLLHELDDGIAALAQAVDPEAGTVSLGFPLTLGTWLVPDLLRQFRADHPGIGFELRQRRDEQLAATSADDRAELDISTLRPASGEWEWRLLLVEPLRLAVAATHPLARRADVSLADLGDEPFIVLRVGSHLRMISDELFADAGIRPSTALESPDVPTAYGLVAAGLGVAIVPEPKRPEETVRYLSISDDGASREVGLVWSARQPLLPSAVLFRDHVLGLAKVRGR